MYSSLTTLQLRDEMANKSLTTKGLGRQIEEKANKLEDELTSLREEYVKLQSQSENQGREIKRLRDAVQQAHQDSEVREQKLKDVNELLRNERDIASRKAGSSADQVQATIKDLQRKTEERDLLQTRHDALTTESQSLQTDLSKCNSELTQAQHALQKERQHSVENELALRNEAKEKVESFSRAMDNLERDLEDERSNSAINEERWKDQKRDLQLQKDKAEQKAQGLQRTVDKLQESEGTLSGREMKLQEALESEKERHLGEEGLWDRQIRELQENLDDKRQTLDETRSEVLRLTEQLRLGIREQAASEEKIQALEDEVDVLQIGLDEEAQRARQDIDAARQDAGVLQTKLHAVKQELLHVEAAHANARAEIEKSQGDARAGHRTTEQLESQLRDLERQIQGMGEEKQDLRSQVTRSETIIERLRDAAASVDAEGSELAILRRDVSSLRSKENEHIQRDTAQRDSIRELKRQIADLERQIHETEVFKLAADSPKSSVGGSARKTELNELRCQLADAHHQMKELRSKMKDADRESQRQIAKSEERLQRQIEIFEEQSYQSEQQINGLEAQKTEQQAQTSAAEKTVSRLRLRIEALEKDLHSARMNQTDDRTIAEERKDLHEMLKDAKLEAEDLQLQVADAESRIQAASLREKDLRTQVKRVRQERTLQTQKSGALSTELDSLQLRYEQKVDEMAHQQQLWEEERRSIVSRVRFPNMSVSSVHAGMDSAALEKLEAEVQKKEKRHLGELKGMTKQIQWLRAKCKREEGFRSGLAYEKKFLLLQIEMFEAWYVLPSTVVVDYPQKTNASLAILWTSTCSKKWV